MRKAKDFFRINRIHQEQPDLPIRQLQSLALKDAMMTGTNLHVAEHNNQLTASANCTPLPAIDATSDVDHPLHIKHYQASKHFYNLALAQQVSVTALGGRSFCSCCRRQTNFLSRHRCEHVAWATAALHWAQHSNPFPSQYVDWETLVPAGANKEDLKKNFGVYTIPDDAKVVILGDFGTGLTDGILMLMSILINQQPDFIIHLGDIYYAGMDSETDAYVNMFTQAFALTSKKVRCFPYPATTNTYVAMRHSTTRCCG